MAKKRKRFRVSLKRSRGRGRKASKKSVFTVAASARQARRFAKIRNPGFKATRAVRD